MSALMDALNAELAGGNLDALSGQLGLSKEQTQSAVAAALPMLVSGMSQNAANPEGAQGLASALDENHSQPLGAIAEKMGGLGPLLQMAMASGQGPKALDGSGMLGHILGGLQGGASAAIAKQAGLDASTATQLLTGLAPLVMSAMGTLKQERQLDASGLTELLDQEKQEIAGGGGFLASLVDSGGDGVGLDDLARIGSTLSQSGLLGKLFG